MLQFQRNPIITWKESFALKFYGPIFPLPTLFRWILSSRDYEVEKYSVAFCVVCVFLCGNNSCRAVARIICTVRCSSALTRRAFLLTIIAKLVRAAAWRKVEKQQPLIVRVTKSDPVAERRIGTRRRPFVMRCDDKNAYNLKLQRILSV